MIYRIEEEDGSYYLVTEDGKRVGLPGDTGVLIGCAYAHVAREHGQQAADFFAWGVALGWKCKDVAVLEQLIADFRKRG